MAYECLGRFAILCHAMARTKFLLKSGLSALEQIVDPALLFESRGCNLHFDFFIGTRAVSKALGQK